MHTWGTGASGNMGHQTGQTAVTAGIRTSLQTDQQNQGSKGISLCSLMAKQVRGGNGSDSTLAHFHPKHRLGVFAGICPVCVSICSFN